MRTSRAFTIVELMVALAVIVLLIGVLMPALGTIKRRSNAAACLSNLRSLQQAHVLYMTDHRGRFIDVGLSHGGAPDTPVAWINTLQEYYNNNLSLKSPADKSPHWPAVEGGQGVPIVGTTDRFRRTSYGRNNYLSRTYSPVAAIDPGKAADRMSRVASPATTVDFLIMAFEGPYAGADHVHVEEWSNAAAGPHLPPTQAAAQTQTNAHGGPVRSWDSVSNYGFLDGHAETQAFHDVYADQSHFNLFDPEVARFAATRRAGSAH